MKVSVLQENLSWALGVVRNALPTKALKPITDNILLQTEMGKLVLTATDLEMAITVKISANIEETGEITVPSKMLINYVSTLPQDAITFTTKLKSLYIDCGKNKSRMPYVPTDDYPLIPEVDGQQITFLAGDLVKIVSYVLLSVAVENSRPVLTGVGVKSNKENIEFASSDGFRLSAYTYPNTDPIKAIIPSKCLSALTKVFSNPEEMVEVYISSNGVLFKTNNIQIMTLQLQGTFPDYQNIVPASSMSKAIVPSNELLRSIKSSLLFSDEGIIKIKLMPLDNPTNIVVWASDQELGENECIIDCPVTGEENKFAVKGKFLTDILSALKDKKISLEINGPEKPILIKDVENKNFLHVIMPISTQW